MSNPQKQQRIFWIEVEKIKSNPMQPRYDFNEEKLRDLADSIKEYGVLQPLIVVRKEMDAEMGIKVEYELIAGERRLRAAQIAGLFQVPVIVRDDEGEKIKLELAIIENLQREDLNPLERARAFRKLTEDFKLKHHEIAHRVGKSRVFVTNTLRLLNLPEEMQKGLRAGIVTEGHMRPLLMLIDRKEEQTRLYADIIEKGLSVREAEMISRKIAVERARKKEITPDPDTKILEDRLSESLGTRVQIEREGEKRKIQIEFFSDEELQNFLDRILEVESPDGDSTSIESVSPPESQQPEDEQELIDRFTI